jgi:RHS repeat-associated protein
MVAAMEFSILTTTNGTTWSSSSISLPSSYGVLSSVSCPLASSLTDCYITGESTTSTPVIGHISYSSPNWSITDQSSAVPYGTGSLTSIGCGYNSTCMALGDTSYSSAQVLYTSDSGSNWPTQFHLDTFGYDSDNNITQEQDGIGTTGENTYSYNNLGEMISSTDEYGKLTAYAYDLDGNETCVGYALSGSESCSNPPLSTNTVVDYTYDSANRMTSETNWMTPGASSCGSVSIPTDTVNFSYDANGNLTGYTLPLCDNSSTSTLDSYGKTYYGDNTINSLTANYPSGPASGTEYRNGQGMTTQDWSGNYVGYDAVGRVNYYSTTAPTSASTATWTYDNQGNLTTSPSGTDSQCYNSSGELISRYSSACPQSPCSSTNLVAVGSYSYDTFGNMTNYSTLFNNQCVTNNYSYNSLGQLSGFDAFFTAWNYYYSANGNLMHETEGSTTLSTLEWNQSTSPNEIISDGTWDYIYGPEGSPIEAFKPGTSNSQIYMITADNQTEILGINASNSVAFGHNYGPWGNSSSPSSSEPQIGYDGGYFDPGTNNWYLLNRFYNQGTGTFITPDPSVILQNQADGFGGAVATNPDTSNLYGFSYNDPINFSDRTGLEGSGNPCDRENVANRGASTVNHKGEEIPQGYTQAGNAYAKHSGRGEFPIAKGSQPAAANTAGQNLLDEILTNPETRTFVNPGGRFPGGITYVEPSGEGVRVD